MSRLDTVARGVLLLCAASLICVVAVIAIGAHSPIGTFRSLETHGAKAKPEDKELRIKPLKSLSADTEKIIGVNLAGRVKVNNFG